MEQSGCLLAETVLRKIIMRVGKSIRSERENEYVNLGIITFREELEQAGLKGEGELDPNFVFWKFVSRVLYE